MQTIGRDAGRLQRSVRSTDSFSLGHGIQFLTPKRYTLGVNTKTG